MSRSVVVIGLDLSLNAPGYIALDNQGHILDIGYVTQKRKKYGGKECIMALREITAEDDCSVSVMEPRKTKTKSRDKEDADLFSARRREFSAASIISFIAGFTLTGENNVLVVMENYAYSTKSAGQMELAEISGLIRNFLWCSGTPLRLVDPLSVKLFATGKGTAKKMHMREAALRAGLQLPDFMFGSVKSQHPFELNGHYHTHDLDGPGTDIVDAYFLARFGVRELQVRRGERDLALLEASERKEFLKVTKSQPTNVLSRPFIVQYGMGEWLEE